MLPYPCLKTARAQFEVLLVGNAMNIGRSWWIVAALAFSLTTFYLTTWEEYHTKRLYLGVISGPVEGILMIVTVFIISGHFGEMHLNKLQPNVFNLSPGSQFWDRQVLPFIGINQSLPKSLDTFSTIRLNELFMALSGAGLLYNIVTRWQAVWVILQRS
jgi:ethanolaminephosphotransferase